MDWLHSYNEHGPEALSYQRTGGRPDPVSKVSTAKPDVDADHGRIETRTATVSSDIKWLCEAHGWPGPKAIGKVERRRETLGKTTTETAYYLLSTDLSPTRPNGAARSHWGVKNGLHWRLDVTMNEDQDRTRLEDGPHNLAVLRHMALNVMQKEGSKDPYVANSSGPDGTTPISRASWHCSEMRLPWELSRRFP
jgi:predicted transposase YbfD/YdcC